MDLNRVHAKPQPKATILCKKNVTGESCSSAKGGRLAAAVMTVFWKRTLLRCIGRLVYPLSQVFGPGRGGASGLLHPRLGKKKVSSRHRAMRTADNYFGVLLFLEASEFCVLLEQPRHSEDAASRC